MKILHYTENVQKQIGSKAKPEPWLHIGISDGEYAIWIWDTRQTIECGNVNADANITGTAAKDNHEPLKNCTCSPYFENALHSTKSGAVDPVRDSNDFKQRLNRLDKLSPAERRGVQLFIKDMDTKYGRHGHSYRDMLEDAKRGLRIF